MASRLAIEVPKSDLSSLDALTSEPTLAASAVLLEPFDGEAVVQAIVVLSSASYPHIRAWIRARADSRKEYSVVIDGVRLTGYSAEEVTQICHTLKKLQ